MSAINKFHGLINRLDQKIGLSQTPVPGFIMGLSGTDSAAAVMMLYSALQQRDMLFPRRLKVMHYVNVFRHKPTWVETHLIPWLQERCPHADFEVAYPLGGNYEPQRWADLNLRSLNELEFDFDTIGWPLTGMKPLPEGRNYWVVNTINATEWELGSYSNSTRLASLSPLRSLWKSEILEICETLGVPQIAIDNARLPDCLCGRAELAAANIELIDDILRMRLDPTKHDPELLRQLFSFIADEKKYNGFKARGSFTV